MAVTLPWRVFFDMVTQPCRNLSVLGTFFHVSPLLTSLSLPVLPHWSLIYCYRNFHRWVNLIKYFLYQRLPSKGKIDISLEVLPPKAKFYWQQCQRCAGAPIHVLSSLQLVLTCLTAMMAMPIRFGRSQCGWLLVITSGQLYCTRSRPALCELRTECDWQQF